MEEKIEELIRRAYRKYKLESASTEGSHPDEEDFALFLQGKLSGQEQSAVKEHILSCSDCSQVAASLLACQEDLKLETVPQDLISAAKVLVPGHRENLLEILLKVKASLLELVRTSGDVLIGQEVVPAGLLRSRNIKSFKDEVTILKDFNGLRVEIKIENKNGSRFDLFALVKERQTNRVIKGLRIALLKDNLELESYLTESGKVVFENIGLGKYSIEIANLDAKLAVVILEIRA